MLKKLVRYGNSNALVLDKAILELLNISEGSVVKISTDGKSIILTPFQPVTHSFAGLIGLVEFLPDGTFFAVRQHDLVEEDGSICPRMRAIIDAAFEVKTAQDKPEDQPVLIDEMAISAAYA